MAKINLGEWTLTQASSGGSVKFKDGTNVNFEIHQDGTVNAKRGELQEQGNRVATRNYVDMNTSTYTDSDAVAATDGNIDADTLDGKHDSAFANSGHTHDSRYYTEGQTVENADMVDEMHASELQGARSVEYISTADLSGSGSVNITGLSKYDEIVFFMDNLSHDYNYEDTISLLVDGVRGGRYDNVYDWANFGEHTGGGRKLNFAPGMDSSDSFSCKIIMRNTNYITGRVQQASEHYGTISSWSTTVSAPCDYIEIYCDGRKAHNNNIRFTSGTVTTYGVKYRN